MTTPQTIEHVHEWTRHQNVTSKGYAMPAYEACACGAARTATDQSAEEEAAMTENHTPTEATDLTVTVRAADLAAVLNAVDYVSDRSLIGPVDRMGDALALVKLRDAEHAADREAEAAERLGCDPREIVAWPWTTASPGLYLRTESVERILSDRAINRDALIRAILSHTLHDPESVENSMTLTDSRGKRLPSYVDAAALADHILNEPAIGAPRRETGRSSVFDRPDGNVYIVPDDGGGPLDDVSNRPTLIAPVEITDEDGSI